MQPKKVLIVRTDRIGDVVLTLPMANVIKKHFDSCEVSFLVREYTKPLTESCTFIDKTFIAEYIRSKFLFFKNFKRVSKSKFDAVFVVSPSFKIALLFFLLRIKVRVGIGYRWYSFLFNKKVFEHRKTAEHHELEYNISMLKKIDIHENINKNNVNFGLRLDEKSKLDLPFDVNKPFVIVHPGSGGSAVDLPIAKIINLINAIADNNINVVITGSKSEFDLCKSLEVVPNVFNLAGRFNLKELMTLIARCTLFVANSTGPIRIASALGKKVVGFYPKVKQMSKERWGPYTSKAIVFEPEDCHDCSMEQCKKIDCMNSIDINKIISYVISFLNSKIGEINV